MEKIDLKWVYDENGDTFAIHINNDNPEEIKRVSESGIFFQTLNNKVVGLEICNFSDVIECDKLTYYYGTIHHVPVLRLCFDNDDVEWEINNDISVGKKDGKIYYLEFPILMII